MAVGVSCVAGIIITSVALLIVGLLTLRLLTLWLLGLWLLGLWLLWSERVENMAADLLLQVQLLLL